MGFLNSLLSSTQIKNAISIAESFLDTYAFYLDSHTVYKLKRKVVENLKLLDGSSFLTADLEPEHIALVEILETAGELYGYEPYDPFEWTPPYNGLMRLIEDVSLRMEKLGYVTKKQSAQSIAKFEENSNKSSLKNTVKRLNKMGIKHSSQKK
jgi:hypothetical protein